MLHEQYYANKLQFLTCFLLWKDFVCHMMTGNEEYIESEEYGIDSIFYY